MKITVYSTQTCPFCTLLTNWLDEQQVSYTEYKVDRDPARAREMIERSGQMGVPFSYIEHANGSVDRVLGFDVPALTQSIQAAAMRG